MLSAPRREHETVTNTQSRCSNVPLFFLRHMHRRHEKMPVIQMAHSQAPQEFGSHYFILLRISCVFFSFWQVDTSLCFFAGAEVFRAFSPQRLCILCFSGRYGNFPVSLRTADISPVFSRLRLEFETAPIPGQALCCVFSLIRVHRPCAPMPITQTGLSHLRPRHPSSHVFAQQAIFLMFFVFFFQWEFETTPTRILCFAVFWGGYRLCVPMLIVQTVSPIYPPTGSSRVFPQQPFSCVFGPSGAQRRHLHLEALYASGPAPVL